MLGTTTYCVCQPTADFARRRVEIRRGLKWAAGPVFSRKLCGGANASGMLFKPKSFSPERMQTTMLQNTALPWQVDDALRT
jgi:hypothetical protein